MCIVPAGVVTRIPLELAVSLPGGTKLKQYTTEQIARWCVQTQAAYPSDEHSASYGYGAASNERYASYAVTQTTSRNSGAAWRFDSSLDRFATLWQ